jgi:hypothetical protein
MTSDINLCGKQNQQKRQRTHYVVSQTRSTTQSLSCHDLNFKWKEVQRVVVRRFASGKEMVKH